MECRYGIGVRSNTKTHESTMSALSILSKNELLGNRVTFRAIVVASLQILVFVQLLNSTGAHVGLTFPPARRYDLDFLDKIRTKAPCGMPKGTLKTSLISGSKFNVTWHLSYPHRGGYRLELMDSKERQLLDLTPSTDKESYVKGDPTAQWHMVELPKNFTCEDCTIRLLREASEWANQYRFWSCADVDILEQRNYKETCMAHGRSIAGRCVCNKGFSGNRCQYEDECDTDTECHGNGKCINLGGTALPKKQCFCNPGFHGEKCSKRNSAKLPSHNAPLDLSRHTKRVLSDRMVVYYKTIPAAKEQNKELEFVLIINGTSYGAIGWRPATFDKTCKRWPYIQNDSISTGTSRQGKSSQDVATVGLKPEAEAEPKAEPGVKGESEAEPNAESEAEPKAESEAVPEAESAGEPLVKPKASRLVDRAEPEQEPEPEAESLDTKQATAKRASNAPHAEPEPETKAEPESEPESSASEPEPENTRSHSEPESEAEPSGSSSSNEDGSTKELKPSEWAPKGDFHPMDCIDLIMGGANGVRSRIRDYYTRDRSTPRLDPFWGGKEDITSATGWEKDGQTVLIFRRKVLSTDAPDHSLNGELHVIWARGQEPGEYYHKPASGLERENPGVKDFYVPDEIKYHGHGSQRGITRINFLSEPVSEGNAVKKAIDCGDSWSYPHGCVATDDKAKPCSYIATWVYQPQSDSVMFTIETKKSNRWTGIGFSNSPQMKNSDAVLGWVTSSGQYFLMDTYMTSYIPPVLDVNQDISGMTGSYVDGNVKLTFSRPMKSTDERDISLDECRFFLFPVEGGSYDAVSKKIRKHEQPPIASSDRICISRKCNPVKKPKTPTNLNYVFDIKLTGGLGNNWQAPPRDSEDFRQLGIRLRRELEPSFKKYSGYNTIQLADINNGDEGAALAKLNLVVSPKSELANREKIQELLREMVLTGKVGALVVDPQHLPQVYEEPIVVPTEDEESVSGGYFSGNRFWIVLGCVAALIALAVIQAGITIYKTTGNSPHKGSPGSGSGMAWRDYSETNYGYDAYDEKQLQVNAIPLQANPVHTNNGHHIPKPRPYHEDGHYGTSQRSGHQEYGNRHAYNEESHDLPPSYRSLPRPANQHPHQHQSRNNGGGGGLGAHNTDFYFMPSQRKYSGEVVRVYVDHNKN